MLLSDIDFLRGRGRGVDGRGRVVCVGGLGEICEVGDVEADVAGASACDDVGERGCELGDGAAV